MKTFFIFIRRLILWLVIFGVIGFVVAYIYVESKGQSFATEKLSAAFKRNVRVGTIRLSSPTAFRIDDVEIDGLIKAARVKVEFSLVEILRKNVIIRSLTVWDPFFVLQKGQAQWTIGEKGGIEILGGVQAPAVDTAADSSSGPSRFKLGFKLDEAVIYNGQVMFKDRSSGTEFEILLANFNLRLRSLEYPLKPVKTSFELLCSIFAENMPFSSNIIKAKGWADLYSRDMDGRAKIVTTDGKEILSAELKSKNNDLAVTGKLNLRNFTPKVKPKDPAEVSSFEGLVFGALQSSGIDISADFTMRTKMDDPKLEGISFAGNLGYNPAAQQPGSEPATP